MASPSKKMCGNLSVVNGANQKGPKNMTNLVQIALAILLQVESSGNPSPPDGDHGIAVGPLQWHQVQVDDYNRRFNDNLTLEKMRDPDIAIPAARKWLTWAAQHHGITIPSKLCARWNQPATGRVAPAYRHRIAVCWCRNLRERRES
jgi:hypothetical protein